MTNNIRTFVALVAITTLAGCGTAAPPPSTAAEFRDTVKQEGRTFEEFTADRAFSDVVYSFKKLAPDCIGFLPAPEPRSETWADGSAKVLASRDGMELHIQRKIQNPTAKTPKDGLYLLVADIRPAGPGQTKVEIYYREGSKEAVKVIRDWASGENFYCPDRSHLF